jgi:hypothetical protein
MYSNFSGIKHNFELRESQKSRKSPKDSRCIFQGDIKSSLAVEQSSGILEWDSLGYVNGERPEEQRVNSMELRYNSMRIEQILWIVQSSSPDFTIS